MLWISNTCIYAFIVYVISKWASNKLEINHQEEKCLSFNTIKTYIILWGSTIDYIDTITQLSSTDLVESK